jgi:hypothetical protein
MRRKNGQDEVRERLSRTRRRERLVVHPAWADKFVDLRHAEGGTVYAKLTQFVLLCDGETVAVVGFTDVSELRGSTAASDVPFPSCGGRVTVDDCRNSSRDSPERRRLLRIGSPRDRRNAADQRFETGAKGTRTPYGTCGVSSGWILRSPFRSMVSFRLPVILA